MCLRGNRGCRPYSNQLWVIEKSLMWLSQALHVNLTIFYSAKEIVHYAALLKNKEAVCRVRKVSILMGFWVIKLCRNQLVFYTVDTRMENSVAEVRRMESKCAFLIKGKAHNGENKL